MTDDVKVLTDRIERTYQNMRESAQSISGLVNAGAATCAEVKAYNTWAIATYNLQKGMLAQLRAAGQADAPALPKTPTLFTWRGVHGADAADIDCAAQGLSGSNFKGLQGVMKHALAGPLVPGTVYLSSNEIEVHPEGPVPAQGPNFNQLTDGQLGFAVIPLVICAFIVFCASASVVALFEWLKTSKIQEETTARMAIQSEAFKVYTAARNSCQVQCVEKGNTQSGCVRVCADLITQPNIGGDPTKPPGSGLSFWGTVGLAAAGVGAGVLAVHWWKAGRPVPRFLSPGSPPAADEG